MERDSKNRVIEETSIYPNGEIDSRIEFEYNDSNQIIKRTYIPKTTIHIVIPSNIAQPKKKKFTALMDFSTCMSYQMD